jgi:hypothetical protein
LSISTVLRDLVTYIGLNLNTRRAHSLSTRGPIAAWRALQPFFDTCAERAEPDQIMVKIYTGDDIPQAWSSALISQLERAPSLSNRGWLSEGPYRVEYWLADHPMAKILSILQEAKPPFRSKLYPCAVTLDIKFRLIDPRTGNLLAYQEPAYYGDCRPSPSFSEIFGSSRALIQLSERTIIYLFLSIPFSTDDPALTDYVSVLQDNLPFKMSPKSWRLWKPSRGGRKYSSSRLERTADGVFHGINSGPARTPAQ